MNIYPDLSIGGPPAPADWTMLVGQETLGEQAAYYADVQREGQRVCRLIIIGPRSEDEARALLAVKARVWIADYLSRPHSGATQFGTLEREFPGNP